MSGSKRPCLLPIRRSTPGLVGVAARRCKIITVQTEHPTGLHRRVALYNTSASAVAGCSCSRPGSKTGGFVEKKIPSCKRHSGPAVGKCSPGRLPGVLQQGCFSQRKLRLDSSATLTIQGEVEEQPDTTTPRYPKAPGCPKPPSPHPRLARHDIDHRHPLRTSCKNRKRFRKTGWSVQYIVQLPRKLSKRGRAELRSRSPLKL